MTEKIRKYWMFIVLGAVFCLMPALLLSGSDRGNPVPVRPVIELEELSRAPAKMRVSQDGVELATLDGTFWNFHQSIDGSRADFVLSRGEKFNRLYTVEDGQVTEIADSIRATYPSASGRSVAYVDEEGRLYLYRDGETRLLGENDRSARSCVLSPDGGTVGFTQDGRAYCFRDGQVTEFGGDISWLGIADGGKYFYFIDETEGKIYVQRGWNKNDRMELPGLPISANRDLSQVFLEAYPEESSVRGWLLQDGRELTDLGNHYWRLLDTVNFVQWDYGWLTTVDVEDFAGLLFAVRGYDRESKARVSRLSRLKMDATEEILFEDVDPRDFYLCADGKTLYYRGENDKLCLADVKSRKMHVLAEDPAGGAVLENGSGLYYRAGNGGVYYRSGTDSPVLLKDSERWSSTHFQNVGPNSEIVLIAAKTDQSDDLHKGTWTVYAARRGKLRKLGEAENARFHDSRRDPASVGFIFSQGAEKTEFLYPCRDMEKIWKYGR